MDISTMWDIIVHEYGIATEEELSLVTAIDGYNEDTLNNVIWVRTGYNDIEQLLDEEWGGARNEKILQCGNCIQYKRND